MKKINLDGWTQFSDREFSKSYISPDEKLMAKVTKGSDDDLVKAMNREYVVAKSANQLGFPTPMVEELFELEDGSVGIQYENIKDKISLSRAIAKEPEKMDFYMEKFANLAKKMHSIEAPKDILPSFKERLASALSNSILFTEEEKKVVLENIKRLPDGNKCLHGDFTPSNGITSPQGDYIIDLGFMSYGDPLFDIGSFYAMTTSVTDDLAEQIFHMSKDMAFECWKAFAKHYFDSDDIDAIIKKVEPYSVFSTMSVLPIVPEPMTVVANKERIIAGEF